jgi:hypothetical protein
MNVEMVNEKIVKPSGKRDGVFKVVKQVKPVSVFGRERRPPIDILFPKDFDTGMEFPFADNVILREGDLILIAGVSNFGKTALCLNFCGENINKHPILMGNEYTTIDHLPSSRFLNRLDAMNWVEWCGVDGEDKFTLLPVWGDYAEHIEKDRLNIIDWINLPGEYYMISALMEDIKKAIGNGAGILVIQKNEGADAGRGGSHTKDFADCELLIDKYGEDEVMLTIGKVKEANKRIVGKKYAYYITDGVKITNFREIVKCPTCYGKGWVRAGQSSKPCNECNQRGYVDK